MLRVVCLILPLLHSSAHAQISFSSVPCNHRNPKIVGGLEADKHEMPFIVSLMRRGGHFCGATIISERFVLTAGHCVCNGLNKIMKPAQIQGVFGLHNISADLREAANNDQSNGAGARKVNFKAILPHPNYQCSSVKNDIALLELVHPITFSQHIQPMCLNPDVPVGSHEQEMATVAGWGWTQENQEDGDRADALRKALVRIWSNGACEKSYHLNGKPNTLISETQLCAGYENGGIDSCWADSGGPLVSKENVLIGVVSTGIGCARPGLPGIYTRVSKYIPWMESVIFANN